MISLEVSQFNSSNLKSLFNRFLNSKCQLNKFLCSLFSNNNSRRCSHPLSSWTKSWRICKRLQLTTNKILNPSPTNSNQTCQDLMPTNSWQECPEWGECQVWEECKEWAWEWCLTSLQPTWTQWWEVDLVEWETWEEWLIWEEIWASLLLLTTLQCSKTQCKAMLLLDLVQE